MENRMRGKSAIVIGERDIPKPVYEERVGIGTTAADTEETGRRFEAVREKAGCHW